MEDQDLPPPLQDMSEEIAKRKKLKSNSEAEDQQFKYLKTPSDSKIQKEEVKKQTKHQESTTEKRKASTIKAGFFYSKPKRKVKEELTEIKPKETKKNDLQIPQVQEAMKSTLLEKQNEWMTPDFLSKVASNPVLLKGFSNPESMQAISLFQTNPKKALQTYGKNPQFRQFLTEFSKIMGKHFQGLSQKEEADQSSTLPSEEDPIKKIIDTDPIVKVSENLKQDILNDQKVQYAIQKCQQEGRLDFSMVMGKDPETAKKLKILIDKGVMNLNRE